MIIRKEIDMKKPLTDEQKQMLEALKTRPVTPDEDCPDRKAQNYRIPAPRQMLSARGQ